LAALTAASAALLSLAGCSLEMPGGAADGSSITIDIANNPSTLDPGLQYDESTYSVYRNIYDQLLRRDPKTNEPVPWLATKWKTTSPTTWVFTMRSGVQFSNGEALTADDAAFSINRILDPKYNSPQYANFSAIDHAKALSDTQLEITTKSPSPTLLTYLTTLSVVPKDYVEKVGAKGLNAKPIGSGAYQLESATSGSRYVLSLNPHYWGKEPAIRTVVFRPVADASSRVSDLQSGQAQLASGLTPDQAVQLQGYSNVQVLTAKTERVAYLAVNALGDTATKNVDIRRAIAMGINYESIIKNLESDYASPIGTTLTPLAFGYPDALPNYRYDPERAKELVKATGLKNITIKFPTSPSFDPQLVQAIQSDLGKIGIKVEIENSDQATYLKNVQDPAHQWGSLRFGQWSCSCLDADGVIYPLFRTGGIWASYSNPEFDKAVDAARATLDRDKRQAEYDKAIDIIAKDVPGIGLFQVQAIYGASTRLNWSPDAVQSLYVDQMTMDK